MPTYDFRCATGHDFEARVPYCATSGHCPQCGEIAQRTFVPAPFSSGGFAVPPMWARRIPLNRFIEAQGEMVRTAERTGQPAPDILKIAKRQAAIVRRYQPELVTGT